MQETVQKIKKSQATAHGMEHWLKQRVTAVANVFLVPWFAVCLVLIGTGYYTSLSDMLKQPINGVVLILLFINVFTHGTLGIRVVIEDYVHGKPMRYILIIGTYFASVFATMAAIFAILNIYFNFNI
ncbi:MAG TPA: succinate dehydrogenase, hydrophobic membrane anchor protein [Alphaproteobacteria bacterium]|nr:succinate dehydrogenase, hydrophobic membrane anchor protein [Alphaproteobacteria bacterium]